MKRLGITRKIALVAAAIGILSGLLFGVFALARDSDEALQDAWRNTDMIVRATLPQVSSAYWEVDVPQVRSILTGLLEDPVILSARVVDPLLSVDQLARSGLGDLSASVENPVPARALVRRLFRADQIDRQLTFALTSPRDGSEIGRFVLQLSFAPVLNGVLERSLVVLALSVLQALLVTGAIFLAMQITVIRPISRLQAAALRVRDGGRFELTGRDALMYDVTRRDEISRLARAFRRTVQALESSRETLQDQVEERTKELLVARNAAIEASKVKSDFLANMSHEFRTPLNAIIGLTDLLSGEDPSGRSAQHLHDMRESARFLSANIEAVLNLSKIEAGQLLLEPRRTELATILDGVMSQARALVQEKPLSLTWEYSPDLPLWIRADAMRLSQILINFASNAVKFTPQGDIAFAVQSMERSAGTCTLAFTIRDNGIGISPDQQQRIFKPFTQAERPGAHGLGGTGLGLAIAQRLAELMGGKITVESAPNRGSAFTLIARFACDDGPVAPGPGVGIWLAKESPRLPQIRGMIARSGLTLAATPESADILVAADDADLCLSRLAGGRAMERLALPVTHRDLVDAVHRLTRPHHNSADPRSGLAGRRVLVVEDNTISRNVFVSLVSALGIETLAAANGAEMLEIVAERLPDAIIMDLRMPVMDGHGAMRILRQSYGARTPPVIATSANATPEEAERCAHAGFADFLPKPVDPDLLRRTLAAVLAPEATGLIDRERGLFYCGGDVALYHQSLDDFRRGLPQWIAALERPETGQAVEALLHQVKGAAAMIGATRVAALARLAENGTVDHSGLIAALAALEHGLEPTSKGSDDGAAQPGRPEAADFGQLARQLRDNDMGALQTLRGLSEGDLPEGMLDALTVALDRLDFRAAEAALARLNDPNGAA